MFRHSAGVSGLGALTLGALRAAGAGTPPAGRGAGAAGPPPRQSDAQLLAAIRTDLARSPFHGEGHRKVHARLRILDGIRVARTRVLRVMRAHGLLSPHRGRQGAAKTHDGRVITQAPNVMWGTDGVRVFTLDDGWGWIFAAVEHWNAECVGWHVCKVGSRFAALDPIAQGLERLYGSLDADVARGLALRMDHGSQYLSDHFLKQIRYWGVHPSFGFVEEPETNGVAERWNRTLKEQAIHGRIFQNLEAIRAAVADFVERYNQTWRLEKLGYHTPIEAREEYELSCALGFSWTLDCERVLAGGVSRWGNQIKNRRRRRKPEGRPETPPGAAVGDGCQPGASARRCCVCCAERISSPCRGSWGSRRRGPRNGGISFWPRARPA